MTIDAPPTATNLTGSGSTSRHCGSGVRGPPPYPGIVLAYPGLPSGPVGEDLIGNIYFYRTAPLCPFHQSTDSTHIAESSVTGIIYGHGASLTIPISWMRIGCGVEGYVQAFVYPPGVYHFTTSNCGSEFTLLGCRGLPARGAILPFTVTNLNLSIQTWIEPVSYLRSS